LQAAEQRVKELEARLEREGRGSSEQDVLQQRLAEELEDERKQHQNDLAECDFTADQTRKKYQGAASVSLSIDIYDKILYRSRTSSAQ
jgi:myosin protein heavy chain